MLQCSCTDRIARQGSIRSERPPYLVPHCSYNHPLPTHDLDPNRGCCGSSIRALSPTCPRAACLVKQGTQGRADPAKNWAAFPLAGARLADCPSLDFPHAPSSPAESGESHSHLQTYCTHSDRGNMARSSRFGCLLPAIGAARSRHQLKSGHPRHPGTCPGTWIVEPSTGSERCGPKALLGPSLRCGQHRVAPGPCVIGSACDGEKSSPISRSLAAAEAACRVIAPPRFSCRGAGCGCAPGADRRYGHGRGQTSYSRGACKMTGPPSRSAFFST